MIAFQEPSVDRELTAWENLPIHGMIYGLSRGEIREKGKELLQFVEPWEFRNRPLKFFSGGNAEAL